MNGRSELMEILAKNLVYFMGREQSLYKNPNALGKAAKVSANTIRNIIDPKNRTTTTDKPEGYPLLDKLQAIAKPLGCSVWELMHPDIEQSIRERELYAQVGKTFAQPSGKMGTYKPIKEPDKKRLQAA